MLEADPGQSLARRRAPVVADEFARLAPRPRESRIDVDEHDQIGHDALGRRGEHRFRPRVREVPPVPSENARRVEKAVGEDHVVLRERGLQHLFDELNLARDVQEELGLRNDVEMTRVAAELADRLGHGGREAAVGAEMLHRERARRERLCHTIRDRGLTAAVDAFENDEHQN